MPSIVSFFPGKIDIKNERTSVKKDICTYSFFQQLLNANTTPWTISTWNSQIFFNTPSFSHLDIQLHEPQWLILILRENQSTSSRGSSCSGRLCENPLLWLHRLAKLFLQLHHFRSWTWFFREVRGYMLSSCRFGMKCSTIFLKKKKKRKQKSILLKVEVEQQNFTSN